MTDIGQETFARLAVVARALARVIAATTFTVEEFTREAVAAHATVHPVGEQYCDLCRPSVVPR